MNCRAIRCGLMVEDDLINVTNAVARPEWRIRQLWIWARGHASRRQERRSSLQNSRIVCCGVYLHAPKRLVSCPVALAKSLDWSSMTHDSGPPMTSASTIVGRHSTSRRRAVLSLLILALTACVSRQPAPTIPNIYVMRHLHTPKGMKDPDLTIEGREHADALARWLSHDPPSAIYISTTKRSAQTAAPTARRFGVTPQTYDPANTPDLIGRVLQEKGTVLVVGHSNTVPDIVAGLGGTRPSDLAHEDFGDIWHVQGASRLTTRTRLSKI
jgi:phosphohistidine phosphatase SixA